MLSFFKINDPYRLVFVLLIILVIRLPLFYLGLPVIIPEIRWQLIGEALAGGRYLYKEVWDFCAPFSAGVYGFVHALFGKSLTAYRSLSILLVLLQAGLFNSLLLKHKAFSQNSYVPALMYVLFMHISFDFFTLSPQLMGMTFVLWALNGLFYRMDETTRDELFLKMGLNLGIAALFYLPYFLFFLVIIAALLLYTGSILRRILLLLYAYLMPGTLAALYFYWIDALPEFSRCCFRSLVELEGIEYLSWRDMLIVSCVPAVIFLIAYFKTYTLVRLYNRQIRIRNVMFMCFVSGLFALWITNEVTSFQFIYFVPCLAFFSTHYLLGLKNWIVSEGVCMLIAAAIVLGMLLPARGMQLVSYDKLIASTSPHEEITKGKSLLILGDNVACYQGAVLATPYLNWQLSKQQFTELNRYDNLTELYKNFSGDMPEVIIDEENIASDLFRKLPAIGRQYVAHPACEHVFLRQ